MTHQDQQAPLLVPSLVPAAKVDPVPAEDSAASDDDLKPVDDL